MQQRQDARGVGSSTSSTDTPRSRPLDSPPIDLPMPQPPAGSEPTSAEVVAAAATAVLATATAASNDCLVAAARTIRSGSTRSCGSTTFERPPGSKPAATAATAAADNAVTAAADDMAGGSQQALRPLRPVRPQRTQQAQQVQQAQQAQQVQHQHQHQLLQQVHVQQLMLQRHQLQQPQQGGYWPTAPQQGMHLGMQLQGMVPIASPLASASGPPLPPPQGYGQMPPPQGMRAGMQPGMQQQALQRQETAGQRRQRWQQAEALVTQAQQGRELGRQLRAALQEQARRAHELQIWEAQQRHKAADQQQQEQDWKDANGEDWRDWIDPEVLAL